MRRSQRFFCDMTNGKYTQVVMDENLFDDGL